MRRCAQESRRIGLPFRPDHIDSSQSVWARVAGPYDLNKGLQLADHLEDEERARKLLPLRK